MITWAADVVPIASALASTSVATQNLVLAIVNREIDDTAWGDLADDGRRYLAAHFGTIFSGAGGGAIAGPVTSETLGQMARSYGTISGMGIPPALAKTWYGVEYYRLLRIATCVAVLVP